MPDAPGSYTLRALGTLDIEGEPRRAVQRLLRQPKRTAVLLYVTLTASDHFTTRDSLMAMFWPESDERHARNALRQSLAFIRACLGRNALLSRGKHGLGIDSAAITCDVLEFQRLLDKGLITDALALYRGDFLTGQHLFPGRAFGDWVERRREHLRRRAADAAGALAAESEREGRPMDAAYWGKRAVDLSPFSEPSVQRLLRLLDRVGDRAGALRAYRGLEDYLAREWNCTPSPETQQLMERVRSRSAPLGNGSGNGHPEHTEMSTQRRRPAPEPTTSLEPGVRDPRGA